MYATNGVTIINVGADNIIIMTSDDNSFHTINLLAALSH